MTTSEPGGDERGPDRIPQSVAAPMLDAMLAYSSEAIIVVADDATIRYASPGVEQVFGHDAKCVVGRSIFEFAHPDDVERTAKVFTRRFTVDAPDWGHQVRVRHTSGRWVTTSTTAMQMPEPATGLALTLRPVDGGKIEIEQSLRQRVAVGEYCNRLGARLLETNDPADVMQRIQDSLSEIALLTGAEVVDLLLEYRDSTRIERHARWSVPEFELADDAPWWRELEPSGLEVLLSDELLTYDQERLATMPVAAAADDRVPWSLISFPLGAGGQRGVLRLTRLTPGPEWTDADAQLGRTAAFIFGRALRAARSEQLLALTYEQGPLGFSIRTMDGELVDCNDQYLDLYRIDRDEADRPMLTDILMPSDQQRIADQLSRIEDGLLGPMRQDLQVRRGDGTTFWARANTVKLNVPGSSEQLILTSVEDVTEMHDQRLELEHSATHDALTGVGNRAAMTAFIERAMRRDGELPSLVVIDLDRFKSVNDSHGHLVGDEVLRTVAERIAKHTRAVDLVARLGGDEFAVVVPQTSLVGLEGLAQRLLDSSLEEFDALGRSVVQRISVGIAMGSSARNASDLLVCADRALYAAKEQGRGCAVVFDDSLHDQVMRRLALENDLRIAVDRGEFVVHFQPEFAIPTGEIIGAEALLRWDHPQRGLLPAKEFIDVAEESGVIDEVGRFALREACRAFVDATIEYEDTILRCNLSAREFALPGLIEIVQEALLESGLEPHRLCLEMTETTLMESPELALGTFHRLHQIGVTSAIDDFGTGYSSLSYLKRFPVDMVKIDQTFVDDIAGDGDSRAIVESIMRLSETMGLETVAEGVENEDQLAVLRQLGCTRAQGHIVSPALSGDEFQLFLAADRSP